MAFRFGLFSDLHVNNPGTTARGFCSRSREYLAEGLARFRGAGARFAVFLGDAAQPSDSTAAQADLLSELSSGWSGYGFPVYVVPGNHEFQQLTPTAARTALGIPALANCFTVDSTRLILLDDCFRPDGVHFSENNFDWTQAILPGDQLDRLSSLLRDPIRTFVFVHNCLYLDGSDPHDGAYLIGNHRAVCDLLADAGCVEAVFQGHRHVRREGAYRGVRYFCVPSPEYSPDFSAEDFPLVEINSRGFSVNGRHYERL